MNETQKYPSPIVSLIPIAFLIGILVAIINAFGTDALSGGSQVALLMGTAVCTLMGIALYGRKWKAFEEAITNNIKEIAIAIIILLIIGALSGTWMVSGVVPTMIYYGMKIIHPDFFLATTCIICSIVSIMTGSSWTTIATIGVALMGIGQAQGFHEGWIAGAIISGAYFGDKMSPLSDTTILAASTTNTPLFTHIRYMLITTIPSIVITLIIFTIAGLMNEVNDTQQIAEVTASLQERFTITPWLFIVPIATGIMIARRVPSIITLFLSAVLASVFALIFQAPQLNEIANDGGLFKGMMMSFFGSTSLSTNNELLTELVATRGMSGMLNTIWLIICAMCFGGAMKAAGMLKSITDMFIRFISGRISLVSSTVASGLFFNITTADQYISIVLTGSIFKDIYENNDYENRLLSRTIEDGVTVTSVLVPWNSCGMTQSTILNTSTLTYLPYCFFNIISPLMSIFIATIGYKIFRTKR